MAQTNNFGALRKDASSKNLQSAQLLGLRRLFDHYDIDKSGYIDRQEFKLLLKDMQETFPERFSDKPSDEKIYKEIDLDLSGEISFMELSKWWLHDSRAKNEIPLEPVGEAITNDKVPQIASNYKQKPVPQSPLLKSQPKPLSQPNAPPPQQPNAPQPNAQPPQQPVAPPAPQQQPDAQDNHHHNHNHHHHNHHPANGDDSSALLKEQLLLLQREKEELARHKEQENLDLQAKLHQLESMLDQQQMQQQGFSQQQHQQKDELMKQILEIQKSHERREGQLLNKVAELQLQIAAESERSSQLKHQEETNQKLEGLQRMMEQMKQQNEMLRSQLETDKLEMARQQEEVAQRVRDRDKESRKSKRLSRIIEGSGVTENNNSVSPMSSFREIDDRRKQGKRKVDVEDIMIVSADRVLNTGNNRKSVKLLQEQVFAVDAAIKEELKPKSHLEDELSYSASVAPFNVLLLGSLGVGKSALQLRCTEHLTHYDDTLLMSTPCASFRIRGVDIGWLCRLKLWDYPGSLERLSLSAPLYSEADAICFVYDITSQPSFDEIWNVWLPRAKEEKLKKQCKFFLIGTKLEMVASAKKSIDLKMAEERAKQDDFAGVHNVSARTNQNVDSMLQGLAKELAPTAQTNTASELGGRCIIS